ncbi:unnamed protein product, partial [Staurois parvus]
QDPAFTLSGLPQYTQTWKCNYFSKYKLLNTFSHQQLRQSCDCPAEHWLKLVGVFILLYMDAKPLTAVWTVLIGPVLITYILPGNKKNSLAIHTKLSMCRMAMVQSVLSGDKRL